MVKILKKQLQLLNIISLAVLVAALCFAPSVNAQDEAVIDVTFNCSFGGLLWVNGTSVVNGSVIIYSNNTILNLAATPTNANYSFSSMFLNGTITTDNPSLYNLTSSELQSNQTISAIFTAEAVPTPEPTVDPSAITSDDALAIGVIALVFAIALPVVLVSLHKFKS